MTRVLIALLALAFTAAASAPNEHVMSEAEGAHFWGIAHSQITWTVVKGPDFNVYYGTAKPPLSGGIEFYMGDHPQESSDRGGTVEGKLGTTAVRWYRFRRQDGTLCQQTQVHFGSTYTGDIWVYSARQSDINALIKELSSYPMFSPKPPRVRHRRPNQSVETGYDWLQVF